MSQPSVYAVTPQSEAEALVVQHALALYRDTQAPGNVEVTIDGTCVNTTEGAREVKVGIVSKRKPGESEPPERWAERELPEIETSVAFAAMEECGEFQKRVDFWRQQLRLGSTSDISALGDGAAWIWSIILTVFGPIRECLDIYHALEHLSTTGKVLYDEQTTAYAKWREETTLELLSGGFELVEKRLNRLTQESRTDREKESIRLLRGYLENNRERLSYAIRLAEGRAIGSGQVEGACKNLIGARLKQTWAEWLVPRLNRMAILCAVRYSGQWEKYWQQATLVQESIYAPTPVLASMATLTLSPEPKSETMWWTASGLFPTD